MRRRWSPRSRIRRGAVKRGPGSTAVRRSPIDPDPNVCRFYGRCPKGADICTKAMPPLRAVGPDHFAACHFAPSPDGGTDER